MTVTELIKILQRYQEEIGCDGKTIGSHKLPSEVLFRVTNLDISLEIDDSEYNGGIELDLMAGCLCPQGVIFKLKAQD